MSVLTGRRDKQTGPVISAFVTAVVLAGSAAALPAFASDGSPQPPCSAPTSGSAAPTGTDTTPPPATGSASKSADQARRSGDDTSDPAPPTDPGCTTTTTPPTTPPTTDAPTTGAPTTTAPPTTPSATTAPPSTTAQGTPTVTETTAAPTTAPATVAPPATTAAAPPAGPVGGGGVAGGSSFDYTDTPPGDTTQREPHGTITRSQIVTRAERWLAEQVPYSQTRWWTDAGGTYRQDCSGYVSMVWDLNQNIDFWTGNLNTVSHTINPADLLPGDTLMSVEHTIIFANWANPQHTEFDFFEEAHPGTAARFVVDAPLTAYTDNGFNAFRYDGIAGAGALPADPATGLSFAALSSGGSEIAPSGVSTTEPAPAPWQQTLPDQQALSKLLASATPTRTPTKVDPQLAAMGLSAAGPAPTRVLLAAALLSALFTLLALIRNPRIMAAALSRKPKAEPSRHRRKH